MHNERQKSVRHALNSTRLYCPNSVYLTRHSFGDIISNVHTQIAIFESQHCTVIYKLIVIQFAMN